MRRELDRDAREHIAEVLNDVVASVGMPFGLSISDRARACAEELRDRGEPEAMVFMAMQGFERELSRGFSRARSAARAGRAKTTDGSPASNGHAPKIAQLAFPVVVPGSPPVLLVNATHQHISLAYEYEVRQLAGRQRNIAALAQFRDATAAWPDRSVGDLLATGDLTVAELIGKEVA